MRAIEKRKGREKEEGEDKERKGKEPEDKCLNMEGRGRKETEKHQKRVNAEMGKEEECK